MKKVCITPENETIEVSLRSLQILNLFVSIGFDKRGSFVGVVQDNLTEYVGYKMTKKIEQFWERRNTSTEMCDDLEALYEKIKAE